MTNLSGRPHPRNLLLVHDEKAFALMMFHFQLFFLLPEFGFRLLFLLHQRHLLLLQFRHQLIHLAWEEEGEEGEGERTSEF